MAIVNDTLTIACGEIYLRDSTGQYQPPFGLAIWNGRQWQLTRVYATGPTGVVSNLVPRGIWALSTTEIWLASGGVFRWNGRDVNATPYWINSFPGNPNPIWTAGQYAQRVWGSSSQRMYAIGTVGAIAVFDGSTWQRIESGTTADINDIWGSTDPGSGLRLTLAAASNVATPGEMKILRITGQNTVDTIGWVTGRRVNSIWFRNERKLFTAGGGVFIRGLDMGWQEQIQIPLVYTRRVRGNGINDVFVVGDFGVVTHFNGVSWRVYPEVAAALYYSCDYNGRSMIAVGERSARAVVLRGHRN
ncbi:MAG TPA: hypothetical protein DGH68_03580 [Bacteroidetes bacterium]|nr:hypothetical protein [Bacteroidota bacterium]